jgi:UDP-2,4-diacetamido-2,4,6-trideoxy-beta-L-altropyranose hydrolase
MNFVFRVDSSIRIGTGHIMRCLTLAEELRRRGAQVRFVCREQAGSPVAILRQRGMPVTLLPPPRILDNDPTENYSAWLGATPTKDAEQTITALAGEQPDWLVIDHYGIDIQWEQSLRPHVHKVMVIDDLANRRHDSDVLLDQNYSTEGGRRYFNLVPETCTRLIGPHYALLRPEYAAYRKTMRPRDGQVDRVLVFLGGSDPQNLTGMALEALSQSELSHLAVDVVVGANNIYKDSIARQAMHRPLTTLHGSLPHLADLMMQANLAIGAGGATTWERMCLGLPSVVISNAENQRPTSEALARVGLIHYAGHFSDVDTRQLLKVLRSLIGNFESFAAQCVKGQLYVDGLGTLRLSEVLYPST